MRKRKKRASSSRCNTCGTRHPRMKYVKRLGARGTMWVPVKSWLPGSVLCKDIFHGVGSWATAQ